MSYRVKLLLVFIAVALITNGISLSVMNRLSSHYLFDGYRDKMLSLTATAATMLDGGAGQLQIQGMGYIHVKGRTDPVMTYTPEETAVEALAS